MNSLKILVSSGNAYARHSLELLVRTLGTHSVISCDVSAERLSDLVNEHRPDILIADVTGRRQDWKTIARLAPSHRVLVVTDLAAEFAKAYPDWPLTELLGSDGHPEQVFAWIKSFALEARGDCLCALHYAPTQRRLSDDSAEPVSITPREREIMELVRQGCCNKRIARALSISITTVRTHRYKMMAKLNLHNAVEIARYAERFANPLAS